MKRNERRIEGRKLEVTASAGVHRQTGPGLDAISFDAQSHREFHLTLRALPGERPEQLVHRLATVLREKNAVVVRHDIFGLNSVHLEMTSALQREFGILDWPVTWMGGKAPAGNDMGGMYVLAVTGNSVQTLSMNGEAFGRIWADEDVRHCVVGNFHPSSLASSKTAQSGEFFEWMEQLLVKAHMSMNDLARTWFFLNDILTWYEPFNAVRTKFYNERKVLENMLPASTGVGSSNPGGAALTGGAWAVQGLDKSVGICAVPSPLQCPAIEYGSAFSRAVLITEPACKRLLLSGTASIAPEGRDAHTGDIRGQIALTMEVVQAILTSQGVGLQDVTRATAYFRNIQDAPALELWRLDNGMGPLPLICTQACICRNDLLFEIELDAVLIGNTKEK